MFGLFKKYPDTHITKLNKWMDKYVKKELKDINKNCKVLPKRLGNCFNVFEIDSSKLKWQVVSPEEDAFNLDACENGIIELKSIRSLPCVKRVLLSYKLMTNLHSYNEFKDVMDAVVHDLLLELKKAKGFGPKTKSIGTCYLNVRLMKNPAAYELRAYSDCVAVNPIIVKKGK